MQFQNNTLCSVSYFVRKRRFMLRYQFPEIYEDFFCIDVKNDTLPAEQSSQRKYKTCLKKLTKFINSPAKYDFCKQKRIII